MSFGISLHCRVHCTNLRCRNYRQVRLLVFRLVEYHNPSPRRFSVRPGGQPMPSPFPGMDPYLEAHWRDVHAGLVIHARDALQGVLPGSLRARVEESVLLETPTGLGDHPLFPDVRVVEYTSKRGLETRPEAGAAVAELLLVEA